MKENGEKGKIEIVFDNKPDFGPIPETFPRKIGIIEDGKVYLGKKVIDMRAQKTPSSSETTTSQKETGQ